MHDTANRPEEHLGVVTLKNVSAHGNPLGPRFHGLFNALKKNRRLRDPAPPCNHNRDGKA